MRCRALLTCDVGKRKQGDRCPHDALKENRNQLCWTHSRALINPERLRPLQLAPRRLAELEP